MVEVAQVTFPVFICILSLRYGAAVDVGAGLTAYALTVSCHFLGAFLEITLNLLSDFHLFSPDFGRSALWTKVACLISWLVKLYANLLALSYIIGRDVVTNPWMV